MGGGSLRVPRGLQPSPGVLGGAGVPPSLPLAFCRGFPILYSLQNGVTPFRWAQVVEAQPGSVLLRRAERGESPAGRALKTFLLPQPGARGGGREAFRLLIVKFYCSLERLLANHKTEARTRPHKSAAESLGEGERSPGSGEPSAGRAPGFCCCKAKKLLQPLSPCL